MTPVEEGTPLNESDVPAERTYTIKRLIRGLSSSRKSARPGFATALTELLRTFPDTPASVVMEMVKDTLKGTAQDKKREQGHAMLGEVLAYLALIRSGLFQKASLSIQKEVVKRFKEIGTEKPLLHHLCGDAMVTLVESIPPKVARKRIFPILTEELSQGWDLVTPDTFLLLLKFKDLCPNMVDEEFLDKNWGGGNLIAKRNFPALGRLLCDSTEVHPLIHNLGPTLIDLTSRKETLFKNFWSKVIIDKVFESSQLVKKYLVLELIPAALSKASPSMVSTILANNVMETLVGHMGHKDKILHEMSRKVVAQIIEFAKSCDDSQQQLAVLRRFITKPSSCSFDTITKTRTVATLVQNLSEESCRVFGEELLKTLHGKSEFCHGTTPEVVFLWSVNQLSALVTCPGAAGLSQLRADILKFLFLHSFFSVTATNQKLLHCGDLLVTPPTPAVLKLLSGSFFKCLNAVTSMNPDKESVGRFASNLGMLRDLSAYAQLLVSTERGLSHRKVFNDKEKVLWSNLCHELKSMQSQSKTKAHDAADDEAKAHDAADDKAKAFELLLRMFSLQLFVTETKETMETIEELLTCYRKSVGDATNSMDNGEDDDDDEDDDTPFSWSDVITELLVSLMSKSSALLRTVCTAAFTMLLPHVTHAGVHLILDVFHDGDDDDDGPLTFSEGQTSDDDHEENGSDSDGAESDDGHVVAESFRNTVQAALGKAALDKETNGNHSESLSDSDLESGSSDDDDNDLSDTEMFKMDAALSEAFKGLVKGRSKKEEKDKAREILHFRLRCMDFLEVIATHGTDLNLTLELLVPLLELAELGQASGEKQSLGVRAQQCFQKLLKHTHKSLTSQHVPLQDEQGEKIPDLIDGLIKLSSNGIATGKLRKDIVSGILLLFKLQRHSTSEDPAISRPTSKSLEVVKNYLSDFLRKRDSKLTHTLFSDLFERHSALFWPLSQTLVGVTSDPEVRIFCRMHAFHLLGHLANKANINEMGAEAWTQFIEELRMHVKKILEYLTEDTFRSGFVLSMLHFLKKCETLSTIEPFDLSLLDALSTKFTSDIKKALRKMSFRKENNESNKRKSDDEPTELSPSKKSKMETTNGSPAAKKSKTQPSTDKSSKKKGSN